MFTYIFIRKMSQVHQQCPTLKASPLAPCPVPHPFRINVVTLKVMKFQRSPSLWNYLSVREVCHSICFTRGVNIDPGPYAKGVEAFVKYTSNLQNTRPETVHTANPRVYFLQVYQYSFFHSLNSFCLVKEASWYLLRLSPDHDVKLVSL